MVLKKKPGIASDNKRDKITDKMPLDSLRITYNVHDFNTDLLLSGIITHWKHKTQVLLY